MGSGEAARTRLDIGRQQFEIDGVRFLSSFSVPSTDEELSICKSPEQVDQYRELFASFDCSNIVELGISKGGSVAMLSLLGGPACLISVELESEPVGPLQAFLDERQLNDRVHLHYGVDQGDRARLRSILDEHLPDGEPLDLVIDDASHLYELTRTSFEVLFPRLRPGGIYLIEDWQHDHVLADALGRAAADTAAPDHARVVELLGTAAAGEAPPFRPLSRLGIELMLCMCSPIPHVDEVAFSESWILVRRGEAELDAIDMRLADLYTDPFGMLSERLTSQNGA